jgi:hypothetical protein
MADIVKRNENVAFLFFKKRERFIRGNSVEPSIQLAVFSEFVQVSEGFDERVLQHIIGIVMVDYNSTDVPVKSFLVCVYEFAERIIPRLRVSKFINQLLVSGICHMRVLLPRDNL